MARKNKYRTIWHPGLWPSWLIVFAFCCISLVSMETKQKMGDKLGRFLHRKLKSRVDVGRKNIAACLPELNEEAQTKLVEEAFVACTKGFFETIHAWWGDITPYVDNLIVTGAEHLEEAQKRGKGILLIGGHFSIFDLALPLFASKLSKPGYMYRPHNNLVIDRMIEKGRRRHYGIQGFNKLQLKDMIEFIKDGGEVWYAADQDFGSKCNIFAPFFGVDAGCVTASSWVARESGASVVSVSQFRHPNGQYEIAFSAIMENFGDDEQKDAEDWNAHLEAAIRRFPDQYLWLHKRFKTRKPGDQPFY